MSRRNIRGRRAVATMLAVVYSATLPAAISAVWIRGSVLSTSGYVAAVTPLATDPAVRATVRTVIDREVSLAASQAVASALPPRAGILAGLLGSGLGSLAGNSASRFMTSPEFRRLWTAANASAHTEMISVLNGSSTAVTATGHGVVLNLAPLISAVLKEMSGPLSRLTGKTVALPAISTVPAIACKQIAGLTRTRMPADCAQIALFPASALTSARRAFRILAAGTLALLILTPAAGAAALLAAPLRRRALMQMTTGGAATVLVTSIMVTRLQSSLLTRAQPRYQPVVAAVLHALTSGFFTLTVWCTVISLTLAAAALLSGWLSAGHRDQDQSPPGQHATHLHLKGSTGIRTRRLSRPGPGPGT